MKKTLFLMGHPRSGTTLLARALDAHPSISFLNDECNCLPFFPDARELLQNSTDRQIAAVKVNQDIEKNVQMIRAEFPDAYVVHIIRDPRDVYHSLQQQQYLPKTPFYAGRSWEHVAQLISSLPSCYELRYEDLTREPEMELKLLSSFLGLKYSAKMLDYDRSPLHNQDLIARGFTVNRKWKKNQNTKFVEAAAHSMMEKYGYAYAHKMISPASRLHQYLQEKMCCANTSGFKRTLIRQINKKLFWLVYMFKLPYAFPMPNSVCIEASTRCNLRCPACPTGQKKKGLSKGFLRFSDFRNFIDKNPFIEKIQLSNFGEPFLNPEIFRIISYAAGKGIKVCADSTLNCFSKKMVARLVTSGMQELTVSIDGASQKTYSKYRVGGDFNKVISVVREIRRYERPKLRWQFVVFEHNKHELQQARQMAQELGMEFMVKQDWRNHNKDNCCQLWHMPVINYNGKMLGCCELHDESYSFGNVFKEGFWAVYSSKKMQAARKLVLKKAGCEECKRSRL